MVFAWFFRVAGVQRPVQSASDPFRSFRSRPARPRCPRVGEHPGCAGCRFWSSEGRTCHAQTPRRLQAAAAAGLAARKGGLRFTHALRRGFLTHQPLVLEEIGAHHACARGLTGKGTRIGIDDTTAEFKAGVELMAAGGADLVCNRPDGNECFSEVGNCQVARTRDIRTGDPEAANVSVRQVVDEDGWPSGTIPCSSGTTATASLTILNADGSAAPHNKGTQGTIVASFTAGKNLGVAPAAIIIPVARISRPTKARSNSPTPRHDGSLRRFPMRTAKSWMIGRQATRGSNTRSSTSSIDPAEQPSSTRKRVPALSIQNWVGTGGPCLSAWMPICGSTDLPMMKTILVHAAGHEEERRSSLGTDLPNHDVPELGGDSLAAAATDPRTGAIATHSNRCGPVLE